MGGYHQTHLGAGWRQGNVSAIVECAGRSAFRMGAHLIRHLRQDLLDHLQIRAA